MGQKSGTTAQAGAKRRITLERTWKGAALQDVWDLWTTKEGVESWWGPEGFSVKVHSIDLRVGGQMRYAQIATGANQIEFMKKAGMAISMDIRITYTEVAPQRRLAYATWADFIPGVEPYDALTTVDLHPFEGGVRMALIIDAMHTEEWTKMAVMGWESELGKLAVALERRA